MISVLLTTLAIQSASAGATVDYNWNGTHLIVNVTSPQGVGSAQIKLNVSSDLTVGSASLTGFMAGAMHIQSETEHRWFQLNANENSNGVLMVPITCSSATGSYEVKLIGVNIKDNNQNTILVDIAMPLYQTIKCTGNVNQTESALPVKVTPNESEKTISLPQKELQTEKSSDSNIKQQETENKNINQTLPKESENITITTLNESMNVTSMIKEPVVQSNNSALQNVKQEVKTQKNTNSNQWLWIIVIVLTSIVLVIIIKKFIKVK